MPNFWSIDDEAERERAFRIANEVNGSLKVGKVVIIKDNTWATSEMFIDDAPLLEDFFQRTLDVTRAAADRFAKRMRDED